MISVWIRRVGCLMMSRKDPAAAAALGFVRTICNILSSKTWTFGARVVRNKRVTCSGSMGFPFILLAAERTALASSILPLIEGTAQLNILATEMVNLT